MDWAHPSVTRRSSLSGLFHISTFGPGWCTGRAVWLWIPEDPTPIFKFRWQDRAVQLKVMSCSTSRILFHQHTHMGTIYLLVRSATLTARPKSWTQMNLPSCTAFQPLEIVCKIISISLLDAALEQGLAGQYLPFHDSVPVPCAAGKAPALTLTALGDASFSFWTQTSLQFKFAASCPVLLLQR